MSEARNIMPPYLRFWSSLLVALGLLLALAATQAHAVENPQPLVLESGFGERFLGGFSYVLEDPGGQMSLADVTGLDQQGRFVLQTGNEPVFGHSRSVFWERVAIHNSQSASVFPVMIVLFDDFQYIDLYVLNSRGELTKHSRTGTLYPRGDRELGLAILGFNLEIPAGETVTCYLRFRTSNTMSLGVELLSREAYTRKVWADYGYMILLAALILSLSISAMFSYIAFWDRTFLAYLSVAMATELLYFVYHGFGSYYLWYFWPWLCEYAMCVAFIIYGLALCYFSSALLELKERLPRFWRVNRGVFYFGLLLVAALPFVEYNPLAYFCDLLVVLAAAHSIVAAAILAWRGYRPALYYLLSMGALLILICLEIISRVGVLATPLLGERSLEWGFIVCTFGWYLAVMGRLRLIRIAREEAQERAQALRIMLQSIIDAMPSIILGVDREARILWLNNSAAQFTGTDIETARGWELRELLPEIAGLIADGSIQLHSEQVQIYDQCRIEARSGIRDMKVVVYPFMLGQEPGKVVQLDDITEKLLMDEMLIQTEKMLSLGRLAAGMAHEINNPLGGIMQGVQNVIRRLDRQLPLNLESARQRGLDMAALEGYLEDRRIPAILAGIQDSSKRAARIVANMLRFSRQSAGEKALIDLRPVIEQALELAANDYDLQKQFDFRHIMIVKDYENDGEMEISGSEIELQQVLLNLFKNSAQAMKGWTENPVIIVRLSRQGPWVVLEVADNGPGIDPAVRQHVFEPFFTTKGKGQGTGLGLSVSYFIITSNHQGQMYVESAPGQGARFLIRLPAGFAYAGTNGRAVVDRTS